MNVIQEKALFHLTGKISYTPAEAKVLKAVAEESPYFAPARFLVTAGIRQSYPYDQWMPHARKTNLYFTNPNWLQLQLEETDVAAAGVFQESPETLPEITKAAEAATVAVDSPAEIREETPVNTGGVPEPIRKEKQEAAETEEYSADEDHEPGALLQPVSESKISGILSSQLADFKKPLEADAALDIDADKKPLHTIDYFVSQGIKVDLSAVPQDKLTTHLLKFTDWLKQVKNAQNTSNPRDLGTNLAMEEAVAENAKNSNETRQIVTESMADVLAKQGQVEKAIQLYIKLSFINPEKSSYFAAKIEQLKGI